MLRLLRVALLVVMTFITLSLVVGVASPEFGPVEKAVLAVGIILLLAAGHSVRRIGTTR